jgi:hypothetical protein
MKRVLLNLMPLLLVVAPQAQANIITLTFDQAFMQGAPGDVLTFTATIANSGNQQIWLNGDSISLAPGFDVNDMFDNAPLWLDAGESAQHLALFQITLHDPFDGDFGLNLGSYALLGGIDGIDQEALTSVPFGATAVAPEPSSGSMAVLGLVGALVFCRFGRRLRERDSAIR